MTATIEATPIFDSVMVDQGVDMMPLPRVETHEEFMRRHGYGQFLNRVELILRGEVPITKPARTRARTPRKQAPRKS